MSKSIKLTIPEQCHEDWCRMTEAEKGRFCQSCKKIVVDFTTMSDREILEFFSKANQNTCGRFFNDQLDRDISSVTLKRRNRWAFMLNMLLPAFFISSNVYSQGGVSKRQSATQQCEKTTNADLDPHTGKTNLIRGLVIDKLTRMPVPFATVQLMGNDKVVSTDADGNFSIVVSGTRKRQIEISSIGYSKTTFDLALSGNDTTYELSEKFDMMEPVVVNSTICRTGRYTTGLTGVVVGYAVRKVKSTTITGWLRDSVNKLIPKSRMKIYPNPVHGGSQLTIEFPSKYSGDHLMEVVDVSGRVILSNQITINSKTQLFTLITSPQWSKGIYCVRISREGEKDFQTQKFVIY